MMKNKLNNKKGFTLVEVITSVAIFAIASIMLIGVIYTSMQITVRASSKYRTQLKAAAGLELIEAGKQTELESDMVSTDGGLDASVVITFYK